MINPEAVTIVIYPSSADADSLTVADAMQQVLDMFALLGKAEARRAGAEHIVWRLERATTNSPLTVSAVAVSSDPVGTVDHEAHAAKITLSDGLTGLLRGRDRASWIDAEAEAIVRRILNRNLNGVGRTDVRLEGDEPPIVIDHRSAARAVSFLEMKAAEAAALIEDLTRTEYGSVEGTVIGLTTHYKKPAFVLRTRLSGKEVKCVLTDDAATKIGSEHAWREAWTDQRVLVPGRLHYNSAGELIKVDADDVVKVESRIVSARDLRDQNFSGGLSPVEHLEREWGTGDG